MIQIVALLAMAAAAQQTVTVTETAGLARRNEPACWNERCWFVTIGAKKTVKLPVSQSVPAEALRVQRAGDGPGVTVENDVFSVDLTRRVYNGKEEDSGVLRALRYKAFDVTLLRTQNRMHWAPSFQRAGEKGYRSFAMWTPVQKHRHSATEGFLRLTREGHHADYPEIDLFAEYRFFAHVPYFLFRSRMTVVKPIEMYWLRNQEMTMDAFFTHAAWPDAKGKPVVMDFEARKPVLAKSPLPADVPWVAFVNLEKEYGFGAVVLRYKASREVKAELSINDGADNGKYWDRRIINQTVTPLQPGEQFEEETAYVLFRAPKAKPLDEFFYWERRIRNPLLVNQ
ncbi:MAG: hypothetical protein JNK87_11570 [Bryobacterales bacterium]|nr:hypothetical protein [Bryobacterales bacterium]